MKIYTRTGDAGETSLYGGKRLRKDDRRIEAYGTVDECNAQLGVVLTVLDDSELAGVVSRLQSELFILGGDLSAPLDRGDVVPRITVDLTERLEVEIDRFESELPALTNFVLPGGSPAAAALHVARAVSRRAERRLTALVAVEPVNPETVRYLNRLSDLLFVLARAAGNRAGVPETIWKR